MLRSPQPATPAAPSGLLQVGGLILDLRARELRRPGARRGKRLTAKAQQVLLALAQRPGEVLTREELLDAAWPDSFPTGDVLTQAIVLLRRCLDEEGAGHSAIETIAKSGYRLLLPVAWLDDTGTGEPVLLVGPPPPRPSPSSAVERQVQVGNGCADGATCPGGQSGLEPAAARAGRRSGVLAAALLAAALAVVALLWRSPAPDVTTQAVALALPDGPPLLTSHAGAEWAPALSPDGRHIAFVADWLAPARGAIHRQAVADRLAVALSTPPPGSADDAPAWSPDGEWIAFRRHSEGPETRCTLWVVAALGGVPRRVGECDPMGLGLAWMPDGRGLLVGGRRDEVGSGLRRVDLASGQATPLPITDQGEEWETAPRVSPDGRWLLYRRGSIQADLYRAPLAGGPAEALTTLNGDLRGHDWLGDGEQIVYALVDPRGLQLHRQRIGHATAQPLGVVGDMPRVAADGTRLVFRLPRLRYRVLALDATEPAATLAVLPSSRNSLLPGAATDGRIAFYSDRGGPTALWIASSEMDPSPQPVAGLRPLPRFAPVWSSDGRHLLVIGEGAEGQGLYELEVDSRRLRRIPLPVQTVRYALYAGKDALYALTERGTERELGLYSLADGRSLGGGRIAGVHFMQVDEARKELLFSRDDAPGLYRVGSDLRGSQRFSDLLPRPGFLRGWRLAGGRLWWLDADPDGAVRLRAAAPAELGDSHQVPAGWRIDAPLLNELEVAADGTRLWLTEQRDEDSDIASLALREGMPIPL